MFYKPYQKVTLDCGTEMVTKQSHKEECDINTILSKYERTGLITHVQSGRPQYLDLPSDMDYQAALNTMIAAQDAFASLPASVRDRYGNDPARFLSAFENPAELEFLREQGLVEPAKGGEASAEPGAAAAPGATS